MTSDTGNTNGFIERPQRRRVARGTLGRLIETAENGKAITMKYTGSGYSLQLEKLGLKARRKRLADGTFAVWCERITPSASEAPQ